MRILLTGGAGYVGSHCLKALKAHHTVVVVDDLRSGYPRLVPPSVPLYVENVAHAAAIKAILRDHAIEAVVHCAAYASVHESMIEPLKYYQNNLSASIALLEAMLAVGVKKLVFSSSCAVYGIPATLPILESTPIQPISPYGHTKACFERILKDTALAHGMSVICLRYFNAAGADPEGEIGDCNPHSPHLIPKLWEVALGNTPYLSIFGSSHPTPDGTCIRDYTHVSDLAKAHVLALTQLDRPSCVAYNLGSTQGYSIQQVIEAAERISGRSIPYIVAAPHPGDPPALYADSTWAKTKLGWAPQYSDLDTLLRTAWKWRQKLHREGSRSV